MPETKKKPLASSFEMIVLGLILTLGFWGLKYWYETSSFGAYLAYAKTISASQSGSDFISNYSFIPQVIQFYNHSLLMIFILPIFTAVTVSLFANFMFFRRINNLEQEIKDIKENLNV